MKQTTTRSITAVFDIPHYVNTLSHDETIFLGTAMADHPEHFNDIKKLQGKTFTEITATHPEFGGAPETHFCEPEEYVEVDFDEFIRKIDYRFAESFAEEFETLAEVEDFRVWAQARFDDASVEYADNEEALKGLAEGFKLAELTCSLAIARLTPKC
jgi:hypothetical protein